MPMDRSVSPIGIREINGIFWSYMPSFPKKKVNFSLAIDKSN
jgi:hypothetical protein